MKQSKYNDDNNNNDNDKINQQAIHWKSPYMQWVNMSWYCPLGKGIIP